MTRCLVPATALERYQIIVNIHTTKLPDNAEDNPVVAQTTVLMNFVSTKK